jgi:hypothetical protein
VFFSLLIFLLSLFIKFIFHFLITHQGPEFIRYCFLKLPNGNIYDIAGSLNLSNNNTHVHISVLTAFQTDTPNCTMHFKGVELSITILLNSPQPPLNILVVHIFRHTKTQTYDSVSLHSKAITYDFTIPYIHLYSLYSTAGCYSMGTHNSSHCTGRKDCWNVEGCGKFWRGTFHAFGTGDEFCQSR